MERVEGFLTMKVPQCFMRHLADAFCLYQLLPIRCEYKGDSRVDALERGESTKCQVVAESLEKDVFSPD
jgi:hypothetical protein